MAVKELACCVILAGCGFRGDTTGRVWLPPPFAQCSIVVNGDLGDAVPPYEQGPWTTAEYPTGMECDVFKW